MNDNLPWVEKYRPNSFDNIISHEKIINVLIKLINNDNLPHTIFYGPPGTGKTTTILAAARKLYGSKYKSMILELNGSDDRGISVVRDQIVSFSKTKSTLSNIYSKNKMLSNVKLIILDEADSMTFDAQFALRRVIETYTNTTRYCIICNYITKIIPALQSRCMLFRFIHLPFLKHLENIKKIILIEKIEIENNAIDKIIMLADGDMRKSINILQSLNMIYINNNIKINIKDVNNFFSSSLDEKYDNIIFYIFSSNTIQEKYNYINNLLKKNLFTINNLLLKLTNFLNDKILLSSYCNINKDITNKIINITIGLSKVEIYSNNSINYEILLLDILSIIEINKFNIKN